MRTCRDQSKRAGEDGSIRIELPPGSIYVMSGISRYALKHGVIDASQNGDRVSLTLRAVEKQLWPNHWVRKHPVKVQGDKVQLPALLHS